MGRKNLLKLGGSKRVKQLGRLVAGVVVGLLVLGVIGYSDLARSGALSPGRQPDADVPLLPLTCESLTVAIVPLVPSDKLAAIIPGQDSKTSVAARELINAQGLQDLQTGLEGIFPLEYIICEPLTIPDEFYMEICGQYRIDKIVDWLMEQADPKHFKTIGVTAQDVYKPQYNYLFGLARISGPACVASSNRMAGTVLLPRLTPAKRWHSLAAHELGHTLGLIHVENKKTLMAYSDSLQGLDRTATNIVADDRRRLGQLWPIEWEWD